MDLNTEAKLLEVECAFAEYVKVLEARYGPRQQKEGEAGSAERLPNTSVSG